jgi:nitrogen fixation/metabolism regulation signal transduction histidine kinase
VIWLRRLLVSVSLAVLFAFALMLSGRQDEIGPSFSPWARTLTIGTGLAVVVLLAVLVQRVWGLLLDLRRSAPGAGLRARLLGLLLALALPPWLLLFGFSLRMVDAALDTWFRADVEQALEGALAVARDALEGDRQAALDHTRRLARNEFLAEELSDSIDESDALELSVLESNGQIAASVSADPRFLLPQATPVPMLERARAAAGLAQVNGQARPPHIETLVPMPDGRWVLARFALRRDWLSQTTRIEAEAANFRSLKYLRGALKTTISLVLGVVLLLGMLMTFFLAFAVARRLVAPVSELIAAARRIGRGELYARVPERKGSELGALGSAFNRMGQELTDARTDLERAVHEAQAQRESLALVQARMSSGLLTLDTQGRVRSLNDAGAERLSVAAPALVGLTLSEVSTQFAHLRPLANALSDAIQRAAREWVAEVSLARDGQAQALLLRGALLPPPDAGCVVIFDDLGDVGRAQRETAWREVARRLAHEIKNPLTPIQLAAERLRRRCMDKLPAEDREVLDKATLTIVAQVEALKTMVNAFSDYAQAPQLALCPLDPVSVVRDVMAFYEAAGAELSFELQIETEGLQIEADPGRLRQLLHNLIRNAVEACAPRAAQICIRLAREDEAGRSWCVLDLSDNGPGIATELLDRLFEPYVTSKPKGTGLGLAIVRRIIEEHGGSIRVDNIQTGARVRMRLPLADASAK